jgi:hypothetical protein
MARGKAGGKRAGGRARSDAEEATDDSQAELNDISAALNTSDKPAGESAGEGRPHLPDGLLQRKIEKEKTEKEQVIKEKELLQKQLDDMRAERQLEQANNAKLETLWTPVLLPPARYARNYFEFSL